MNIFFLQAGTSFLRDATENKIPLDTEKLDAIYREALQQINLHYVSLYDDGDGGLWARLSATFLYDGKLIVFDDKDGTVASASGLDFVTTVALLAKDGANLVLEGDTIICCDGTFQAVFETESLTTSDDLLDTTLRMRPFSHWNQVPDLSKSSSLASTQSQS